jgi:cytochrome c oxidase cbb3-type subunit 4
VDINVIREAVTILAFASFMGIAWWAYTPRRKKQLDEIGRSVLDD